MKTSYTKERRQAIEALDEYLIELHCDDKLEEQAFVYLMKNIEKLLDLMENGYDIDIAIDALLV